VIEDPCEVKFRRLSGGSAQKELGIYLSRDNPITLRSRVAGYSAGLGGVVGHARNMEEERRSNRQAREDRVDQGIREKSARVLEGDGRKRGLRVTQGKGG